MSIRMPRCPCGSGLAPWQVDEGPNDEAIYICAACYASISFLPMHPVLRISDAPADKAYGCEISHCDHD